MSFLSFVHDKQEVLEALFDGQMPVTTSAVAAANRIQGLFPRTPSHLS
jgi:hypothetical protein